MCVWLFQGPKSNLVKHSSSVSCVHKGRINPEGQCVNVACAEIMQKRSVCAAHLIVFAIAYLHVKFSCKTQVNRFYGWSWKAIVCFFGIIQPCFQIQQSSQSGLNLYFFFCMVWCCHWKLLKHRNPVKSKAWLNHTEYWKTLVSPVE